MSQQSFNFERFTDTGKSFSARVTIRQNGQLGFNAGARNQYNIENYTHAILFYDSTNRAVGILPTKNTKEQGAIRLVSNKQNTFIAARSFLDRYGIDYGRAKRFRLEKVDNLLVFELDRPIGGGEAKE